MNIQSPYSKVIWCLLIGIVCTHAAQFISIPFLALYLANKTHFSLWISGLVVGVAPFSSMFGGFLGGQLSDKYGRTLLLYTSIFASAVIFVAFYWACHLKNSQTQFVALLILNAAFGLFSSFFQPAVMALMTDLVAQPLREKVFHLRYAAINIGAVIGPLVGTYLGITLSPFAFFFGGMIYLLYGLILCGFLSAKGVQFAEKQQKCISISSSLKVVLSDKRLLHYILFNVLFAVSYSQITSTLAQFIAKILSNGTTVYSLVIALNALFVLLGQTPVYMLCKKIPKNKSIFYGCIIFCLGYFALSYSGNSAASFYCSILIVTLGELLVFPLASKFIDDIAPAHLRGTYFGALTFRELGLFLGPILGGVILQFSGGQVLFLSMGLLALFSYYFVVLSERAKYGFSNKLGEFYE